MSLYFATVLWLMFKVMVSVVEWFMGFCPVGWQKHSIPVSAKQQILVLKVTKRLTQVSPLADEITTVLVGLTQYFLAPKSTDCSILDLCVSQNCLNIFSVEETSVHGCCKGGLQWVHAWCPRGSKEQTWLSCKWRGNKCWPWWNYGGLSLSLPHSSLVTLLWL